MPRKKPPAKRAAKATKPPAVETPPITEIVKVEEPAKEPAEAKEETWEWTPERERALEHMLVGNSKSAIATELNVHRNTVHNWSQHPEFQARLKERQGERGDVVRTRRHVQTEKLTERVYGLADKALTKAEATPDSPLAVAAARGWLAEFRSFREQERMDMGDNVQHVQTHVTGAVTHEHSVTARGFKSFLTDKVKGKIIDVESIERGGAPIRDAQDLIVLLTQQALLTGDELETLHEEEKSQKFEPAYAQAEKKVRP